MAPLSARTPILAAALAAVVAPCLALAQPPTKPDLKHQLKADLYITGMAYMGGKLMFSIRNQGVGNAVASKLKMSCQIDPNSPASCAVTFKPTRTRARSPCALASSP